LGTLDPMATGVLPLVINKATKSASVLGVGGKEYEVTMELGSVTDTYDAEGKVIENKGYDGISEDDVVDVLKGFLGKSEQVPPMYSAVKKGGVPLYKLARKGVTIEREPKTIEIFSMDITKVDIPTVEFTVSCSGGTYVRSICYDAGEKLGSGAYLKELRRTKSGNFSIDAATDSTVSKDELIKAIIPLETLISKRNVA
ncbi:MAG: tRNA pseudouridine(55) synthase TruB, partial [Deltaproteobacteria bacterium]|nr:tRNA pseudouridine(55) synthase TruB [Deltaproteobacteria bacterium]